MSKPNDTLGMSIVDPQERIRYLSKFGNLIEVDPNMPVTRYYRSGKEMLRMANVYLSEGNHENAFILFMKYMTLFIEKIRTHPNYANIRAEVKNINKRIKEEIMPMTEKLRAKLLDRYEQEYIQFLINKEEEEEDEKHKRLRDMERGRADSTSNVATSIKPTPPQHVQISEYGPQPTAPDLSLLDHVVYPNDFPTGSNRIQLPSTGLILPDQSKDKSKNVVPRPAIDRTLKPEYDRSDSLLAGSLRSVVIPENAMDVFLKLAQRNTQQNVETCGILAGHLAQNRLFITHIIVPKQEGTPDSCTTMNEEEIFDVQDQQNLITLGWIHTHPSQTAFLSSVDLHTHCSYQMMMPEAIAIVCAPKYKTNGFFILTPNYGLNFIAQCRQKGFHPHPNDPPLFKEAQHIQLDSNSIIKVVDLRR